MSNIIFVLEVLNALANLATILEFVLERWREHKRRCRMAMKK